METSSHEYNVIKKNFKDYYGNKANRYIEKLKNTTKAYEKKMSIDYVNQINKLMEDNIAGLNKNLPAYSKIASVKMQTEEFEKTPKRSIKRFLYQH